MSTLWSGWALADPVTEAATRRWQTELEAFARSDLFWPPAAGGVLFVGSSSIRMWPDLEQAFPDVPGLIQRGFGGSRLVDCADLVPVLVLPYRPRLVVLYAGENDLLEGSSAHELFRQFLRFAEQVRAALPDTRIAYISIKPSPSRMAWQGVAREANRMIQEHASLVQGLDFIDVFFPMLDAAGAPRSELFLPDQLHLSAEGYALWRSLVSPHLQP